MAKQQKSVYATIADDIISKIQKGTYKVESLLPPERVLMDIYKVQRTTIRRGLDILAENGYIVKVAGLGSVVKSKVAVESSSQAVAENVSKEKEKPISILLPKNSEKNFDKLPNVLSALAVALNASGASFMTDKPSNLEKNASVIVAGHEDIPNAKNICLALSRSDDYRSVVLDSDKAAFVALTYLEELGHTKIGFVGADSSFVFENAFYDSFAVVNSYFDEDYVNLSGADEKAGFDGYSELFRRHGGALSAICVPNDDVARGVLKAAKYYKVSVPEALSVISLCSTDKKNDISAIYFDIGELANEVIESAGKCHRVSAILFGGELKKGKTSGKVKEITQKKSSFLL